MGPYYDSIYLMVRQLPEPPEHHREADGSGCTAPISTWQSARAVALVWLKELLRILKQPVRRTWAVD